MRGLQKSKENQRESKKIQENQRKSEKIKENQRKSKKITENQRKSKKIHENQGVPAGRDRRDGTDGSRVEKEISYLEFSGEK